jgi:acyl dehydratase
MRAYLTILPERPPGNIHGRQRVTLHRAVTPGECVDTTLACVGQEVRGDRRMVSLAVHALTAVGPWFEAEMTILWAR